ARVNDDVVVARLEPFDRRHANRYDLPAVANEQAWNLSAAENFLGPLDRRRAGVTLEQRSRAFQCAAEAVDAKRLEQIVDGAELESGDGESIVGRREDHGRLVPQSRQQIDARD